MVAFATDYQPGTATVEPKNRVGNFFLDVPGCIGIDGPQTRTGTGENGRFSYDACQGVSLAQGEQNQNMGPVTWRGNGTYSALSIFATYGKWEATLFSSENPPRGANVFGTVKGGGLSISLKSAQQVYIEIQSPDEVLSPRGGDSETYVIGELALSFGVPGASLFSIGASSGARGGVVPISNLNVAPIFEGPSFNFSLSDILKGDFSGFRGGISLGGYEFLIDEVEIFDPGG